MIPSRIRGWVRSAVNTVTLLSIRRKSGLTDEEPLNTAYTS